MRPARLASRLLIALVCLVMLGGAGYFGVIRYLVWRESASPSTARVLVLKDGRRIPLSQPTYPPVTNPPSQARATPSGDAPPSNGEVSAQRPAPPTTVSRAETPVRAPQEQTQPQVMPPVRLLIPGIGAEWPVVLSNGKQLPRFKGIGWLLGSAFPGAIGNMVLFGHLDGEYATLGRLKDLKPGDAFSVLTDDGEYRYRVRSVFETSADNVGVMAPSSTATATLITCSGRWDNIAGMYDRRLIVTADYLVN